ncbi:MAG: hypothetical protein PHP98_06065 [Kiritimatiellae bacterium]|nr:hypothetical protein [Kiritimatiellia bacterium]
MTDYHCTIKTHGCRQLEVDLKYPLVRHRDKACFQFDCYLFNPYQLAITAGRYGVAGFFRDLRSYTRYTVPAIPLDKLIDPACEVSPLSRIYRMLSNSGLVSELNERAVIYELRVLANVYHAQLSGILRLLGQKLDKAKDIEQAAAYLESSLNEMDCFLEKFRRLHQEFLDAQVKDMLREGLLWADEAISLHTEKFNYRAYRLLLGRPGMDACRQTLEKRLDREQQYRKQRGYAAIIDPGNETGNELFVYREGLLKKWSEGCLYLSRLPSSIAAHVAQIMMGTAAGIAMVFAVMATIFASRWFVAESLPWVVLIVLGYIAKDRIKDSLRAALITMIPSLMADQMENLIDPALDKKVGNNRARARFCRPDQVPELVTRLRDIRANVFKGVIPPENVLHYHKEIRFDAGKIRNHHKRLESLTEIIRLKMDYWFANMDDPANRLFCVQNGKIAAVTANRVYHVNMIVCLTDRNHPEQRQSFFRYRLILTRNGILRIETLESFPVTI